jgi:methenyltetrahydromethanopterin cyclohydrolase
LAEQMADCASSLRVAPSRSTRGALLLDCGIQVEGGVLAGLGLARVCLAGLGEVELVPGEVGGVPCPHVQVTTDRPVLACLASQYAGWDVRVGAYSAMGSGPMRAAYGHETLFDEIPGRERPLVAVGVLEARNLPDDEVITYLSECLGLPAERLTLLAAPAASLAGTVQVVARSVETALHKLHQLRFDLSQVVSGFGVAPLPPVAPGVMAAVGRANDAILYGGRVVLWVRGDDERVAEVGPRVPAGASADFGEPFAAIFERSGRDFYKIDPMLFSPAQVVFQNLKTGRSHTFGHLETEVLRRSFFDEG